MNKSILASKTVWGAVISLIFGVLAALNVQITDTEYNQGFEALGVVIGFAITLYGRVKARLPLKSPAGGANVMLALLLVSCLLTPAFFLTSCSTMSDADKAAAKKWISLGASIGLQIAAYEWQKNDPGAKVWIIGISQILRAFTTEAKSPPRDEIIRRVDAYLEQAVKEPFYRELAKEEMRNVFAACDEYFNANPQLNDADRKAYIAGLAEALEFAAASSLPGTTGAARLKIK